MTRIVYLSPFPTAEISGGVKVMFRHVEMLCAMGYDACVFSPAGRPNWLATEAPLYSGGDLFSNPDHILVFPECLNGALARLGRAPAAGRKVLLCQNQYGAFCEAVPAQTYRELGFDLCLTVGEVARGFLQRVFAPQTFEVVPVWIDETRFAARPKRPSVATFPRKMPTHHRLIRQIFRAKYPHLRSAPWIEIENRSEAETAAILGEASVFLSLCQFECAPLSPLEAMASGCLVAGYHGYGGLEYATAENGLWLAPDHLEETADALARLLEADMRGDAFALNLRANGAVTAAGFSRERTQAALDRNFRPLCATGRLDLDVWLADL